MARPCVWAIVATVAFALWSPSAAAGMVLAEASDDSCTLDTPFIFCVNVIVRGQLSCGIDAGLASCAGTQEWIRNAGSVAGLPGEVDATYFYLLRSCVGEECLAETADLAFPHCAWEPMSLGCGGMELASLATPAVALAPGGCLTASLSLGVAAHAVSPSAGLVVLDEAASAATALQDSVCA